MILRPPKPTYAELALQMGAVLHWEALNSVGRADGSLTVAGSGHSVVSPGYVQPDNAPWVEWVGASGNTASSSAAASVMGSAAAATMCGWFYLANPASNRIAALFRAVKYRFGIVYEFNNVYFLAEPGATYAYRYCSLTTAGWHHLAVVFDGSQTGYDRIIPYIDGVPATSLTNFGTTGATLPVSLGAFYFGSNGEVGYCTGRNTQTSVFLRALPAADIKALYLAGVTGL